MKKSVPCFSLFFSIYKQHQGEQFSPCQLSFNPLYTGVPMLSPYSLELKFTLFLPFPHSLYPLRSLVLRRRAVVHSVVASHGVSSPRFSGCWRTQSAGNQGPRSWRASSWKARVLKHPGSECSGTEDEKGRGFEGGKIEGSTGLHTRWSLAGCLRPANTKILGTSDLCPWFSQPGLRD